MKTFSITDVGLSRTINEDNFYTCETSIGNLPNLFIVADGMGGHKAGEYASKYTTDTIVDGVRASKQKNPVLILEEAVKEANEKLIDIATEDDSMHGMGTTVVIGTVIGTQLFVANVGDSRLYIVNDQIEQITQDHSLVEEMVRMGELDKEAARNHPDKNIITRAIGASREIKIDFFQKELTHMDVILLCSDGLTNMVEDEEIRQLINGQRDVVEIAEMLIQTANQNGGKDNITVVVIEPFTDEVKEC